MYSVHARAEDCILSSICGPSMSPGCAGEGAWKGRKGRKGRKRRKVFLHFNRAKYIKASPDGNPGAHHRGRSLNRRCLLHSVDRCLFRAAQFSSHVRSQHDLLPALGADERGVEDATSASGSDLAAYAPSCACA
jgi:hypothetical protein